MASIFRRSDSWVLKMEELISPEIAAIFQKNTILILSLVKPSVASEEKIWTSLLNCRSSQHRL
jgi:hypothetical protein